MVVRIWCLGIVLGEKYRMVIDECILLYLLILNKGELSVKCLNFFLKYFFLMYENLNISLKCKLFYVLLNCFNCF